MPKFSVVKFTILNFLELGGVKFYFINFEELNEIYKRVGKVNNFLENLAEKKRIMSTLLLFNVHVLHPISESVKIR